MRMKAYLTKDRTVTLVKGGLVLVDDVGPDASSGVDGEKGKVNVV